MEWPPGDTWRRAAEPLLSLRRPGELARDQGGVPTSRRGRRESPQERRFRPRGQPHLELRSVAARDAALAEAVSAVHGEVRALLVAARQADRRRRRLPGAPRTRRSGGDPDRRG